MKYMIQKFVTLSLTFEAKINELQLTVYERTEYPEHRIYLHHTQMVGMEFWNQQALRPENQYIFPVWDNILQSIALKAIMCLFWMRIVRIWGLIQVWEVGLLAIILNVPFIVGVSGALMANVQAFHTARAVSKRCITDVRFYLNIQFAFPSSLFSES